MGPIPDRLTPQAVTITDELRRRSTPEPDHLREKLALQDLARQMADDPAGLLPRLVRLAMELCEADSAGISILEGAEFRWFGLTGRLAAFEGATTPRDFSPCGVCLDAGSPILMQAPERAYDWIADAEITVPEVLLVPLLGGGGAPLGTLWIVARDGQRFDQGHARVMTELANFTGAALHMVQADARLKKALEEQEALAREMRHRITNLLAVTESLVHMTARSAGSKEEMAATLSGRLRALSDAHVLVRASFDPSLRVRRVDLKELTETVLRPHRIGRIDGAPVPLGEHATNALALVLYELATNAAKYGALSTEAGTVDVSWTASADTLVLDWGERGGPPVSKPARSGFGSRLVQGTIGGLGGSVVTEWSASGLQARVTVPLPQLAR
jgi:two-component sensor histidine kinase